MAIKKRDAKKGSKFTKEQLALSKKYIDNVDVVNVVLMEGQEYTLEETDELIENFMKGKVK